MNPTAGYPHVITPPNNSRRNILITSALPYVNNSPHLGTIIGCVLSADVYARFCWLRGYNALYICGSDQYGTASENKALEEGMPVKELCAKYHAIHEEVYKWFDIAFDAFGKTSTDEQTKITTEIFTDLKANGYTSEATTKQLFCEQDQRFLSDRFVEGECPICKYTAARGDQCDSCSATYDAIELIDPKCKMCSATPIIKESTHIFLNLETIQSRLALWIKESIASGHWSTSAETITNGWLNKGLHSRSITRDLKWGTPVPDPNFADKVFYVWFDAPIGYISITAKAFPDQWEAWWKNPKEVEYVQFMAKDNVPFHSTMFPATLLGTTNNEIKSKWTLVNSIASTEYLMYENGAKFSKSRSVGIFGVDIPSTKIPVEVWRYYLLATRPEGSDSEFSWNEFQIRNNSDLVNKLGNFINRIIKFTISAIKGIIPPISDINEYDSKFINIVNELTREYVSDLETIHIRSGLTRVMSIAAAGNKYLQDTKPWELSKTDPARMMAIIAVSLRVVYHIATLIHPYMPTTAAAILKQLSATNTLLLAPLNSNVWDLNTLPAGETIGEPFPLFNHISDDTITKLRKRFSGN